MSEEINTVEPELADEENYDDETCEDCGELVEDCSCEDEDDDEENEDDDYDEDEIV